MPDHRSRLPSRQSLSSSESKILPNSRVFLSRAISHALRHITKTTCDTRMSTWHGKLNPVLHLSIARQACHTPSQTLRQTEGIHPRILYPLDAHLIPLHRMSIRLIENLQKTVHR